MTILYLTFGVCLVAGAALMLCNQTAFEWKHSEQKATEEFLRFRYYMKKLDIEKESQRHIINDIKSIDELIKVNIRLKRVTQAM